MRESTNYIASGIIDQGLNKKKNFFIDEFNIYIKDIRKSFILTVFIILVIFIIFLFIFLLIICYYIVRFAYINYSK